MDYPNDLKGVEVLPQGRIIFVGKLAWWGAVASMVGGLLFSLPEILFAWWGKVSPWPIFFTLLIVVCGFYVFLSHMADVFFAIRWVPGRVELIGITRQVVLTTKNVSHIVSLPHVEYRMGHIGPLIEAWFKDGTKVLIVNFYNLRVDKTILHALPVPIKFTTFDSLKAEKITLFFKPHEHNGSSGISVGSRQRK